MQRSGRENVGVHEDNDTNTLVNRRNSLLKTFTNPQIKVETRWDYKDGEKTEVVSWCVQLFRAAGGGAAPLRTPGGGGGGGGCDCLG